jgi:outer membrane protein assembly factor BamB
VAHDTTVYVGDSLGFLHALDEGMGVPKWRFAAGSAIDSCVAVGDSRLLITTALGRLECLDVSEKPDSRWLMEGVRRIVSTTPTTVYATTRDGSLRAVSLADGSVRWEKPIAPGTEVAGAGDGFYLFDESGNIAALRELD